MKKKSTVEIFSKQLTSMPLSTSFMHRLRSLSEAAKCRRVRPSYEFADRTPRLLAIVSIR